MILFAMSLKDFQVSQLNVVEQTLQLLVDRGNDLFSSNGDDTRTEY